MPDAGTVLVLGAGPTGLGAGLGLSLHGSGRKVLIVEKEERPGGLAGSFSWNSHTIDYGPHRLAPQIPLVRVVAEELLGPDLLRPKTQHGVHLRGKCYQFPPRVVDWIDPLSFLFGSSLAASFCWSKVRWVTRRFSQDTFESTVSRRFGGKFYRAIAAPMARKVWAEPESIDPAFVDQRFGVARPLKVLRDVVLPRQEANPAVFYYPRLGFQQLWDSMALALEREGQEILYRSAPVRIEVEQGRIARVHLEGHGGRRIVDAKDLFVVSTIPVAVLVRLLSGFPVEGIEEALAAVRIRSMILAAFEFDTPQALPYRTLIFPEEEFCFNRLFEQNAYSRDTVRAGRSVVVADVTLTRGDPGFSRPDEEILAEVRRDLGKLEYLPLSRVTASTVRRIEYAYVVPDLATRRAMYRIHHALKSVPNLAVMGRFGAGEYDNSDYAVDNGVTLGAYLSGRISKLDFLCRMHEKQGRAIAD